jgi:RNA polymerase sigma-70 factor (ECF subfamily)
MLRIRILRRRPGIDGLLEEERGVCGLLQLFFAGRRSILRIVDTASSQPGELTLAMPSAEGTSSVAEISGELLDELWRSAEGESCALTRDELATALAAIGAKHNHGQPPGIYPDAAQKAAFYRGLRLPELALAQACALGRDAAWERFLAQYRSPLTRAAIAITGSATLGHDLADSLYSELFGLTERDGVRRSPLRSYSGRGSLLGWLRTTLAQRHIDHHRKTYRETPLDTHDPAAPEPTENTPQLNLLGAAVANTLRALNTEDRFLLASYFLDQQTLLQIGRLLKVHEATISRRLKRLTADVRKQLLRNLQSGGLRRRAAEEMLGTDPRDLELNLRKLLQSFPTQPFQEQAS